jgi:hypothetical protein
MNPMRPRRIQDSWRSEQLAKSRREKFEGAGHAWRRIHVRRMKVERFDVTTACMPSNRVLQGRAALQQAHS